MLNLLILTTRKLNSAPRVLREIEALYKDFNIYAVGNSPPDLEISINFIDVSTIRQSFKERLVNNFSRLLRITPPVLDYLSLRLADMKNLVEEVRPQIVICHEPHFLPFLIKLKKFYQFNIVYNAHEYHPLEFSKQWFWRIFWKPYYENIYRTCLPSVDLFINVCDSIARKCYEKFNKKSIVIPNASSFHNLAPRNNTDQIIRIIHHGGCIPNRKIEVMIKMAEILGLGYQLDLMLTEVEKNYFDSISEMISKTTNVNLLPPVKFKEIVPFTNQYDIGLYILPPTSYNDSVALPNKLFEFIQARLCIAIGPSPEMSDVVRKHNLGVISDDFTAESMARTIKTLNRTQIDMYKNCSHKAANKLSAENFNRLFVDSIKNLIKEE